MLLVIGLTSLLCSPDIQITGKYFRVVRTSILQPLHISAAQDLSFTSDFKNASQAVSS
jgi:hypothetical protein